MVEKHLFVSFGYFARRDHIAGMAVTRLATGALFASRIGGSGELS
jgi:hypothetical protein